MNDDPAARIAANSQRIVDVFRFVQVRAEAPANPDEMTIPVEAGYWRAHQRLYDIVQAIITGEERRCVGCLKAIAHPLSEYSFCMKCHFDLREEVLP